MKGVAVLSTKGGVGKTTLCHLLAIGCGWRDKSSYVFHTDDREPMRIDGRPYAYIDARKTERIEQVVSALMANEGYFIFDGGGNRPEFDRWIADSVDLVLIPVTADTEAVQMGRETMQRLERAGVSHARYLLNMTSSNRHAHAYDTEHYFSELDNDKIIGRLKRVDAVKRLRNSDDHAPFPTPPTNVNNLSRSLLRIVDQALGTLT